MTDSLDPSEYYTVGDIARVAGCSLTAMSKMLKELQREFPPFTVIASSRLRIYKGDVAIAAVVMYKNRAPARPWSRAKALTPTATAT